MITQQRLREVLNYDVESGVFTWIKPTSRRTKLGAVAGTPHSGGYVQIRIDTVIYLAHRLAWLYVYGTFPDQELDHIDRTKTNNRLTNLRECTSSQNKQNRLEKASKTGFHGIRLIKGRWFARLKTTGKEKSLGGFSTPEEAYAVYLVEKKLQHSHFIGF